jgi:putative membrane protein
MDLMSIDAFVSGFLPFMLQTGVALGLYTMALFIYVLMTPHKEMDLIREGNPSAALAFGGVAVGLAIPLGAHLQHANDVLSLIIWGVLTLLLQLIVFRVADMILHQLPDRISKGDVAAAVTLMALKIALALILAGAARTPLG